MMYLLATDYLITYMDNGHYLYIRSVYTYIFIGRARLTTRHLPFNFIKFVMRHSHSQLYQSIVSPLQRRDNINRTVGVGVDFMKGFALFQLDGPSFLGSVASSSSILTGNACL